MPARRLHACDAWMHHCSTLGRKSKLILGVLPRGEKVLTEKERNSSPRPETPCHNFLRWLRCGVHPRPLLRFMNNDHFRSATIFSTLPDKQTEKSQLSYSPNHQNDTLQTHVHRFYPIHPPRPPFKPPPCSSQKNKTICEGKTQKYVERYDHFSIGRTSSPHPPHPLLMLPAPSGFASPLQGVLCH